MAFIPNFCPTSNHSTSVSHNSEKRSKKSKCRNSKKPVTQNPVSPLLCPVNETSTERSAILKRAYMRWARVRRYVKLREDCDCALDSEELPQLHGAESTKEKYSFDIDATHQPGSRTENCSPADSDDDTVNLVELIDIGCENLSNMKNDEYVDAEDAEVGEEIHLLLQDIKKHYINIMRGDLTSREMLNERKWLSEKKVKLAGIRVKLVAMGYFPEEGEDENKKAKDSKKTEKNRKKRERQKKNRASKTN